MPIGTPTTLGEAFTAGNPDTTIQMTVAGAGAAVGDLVIVVVVDDGGANIPSGVVDSQTNTYTPDDAGQRLADNYTRRRFSSVITTALTAGDTITGTVNGGGGNWDKGIVAAKISPSAGKTWDSARVDQSAAATGNSNTPDSGVTSTTTVADELVFGDMVAGGAPSTTGGGPLTAAGTDLTRLHNLQISAFVDMATVYRIVTATGAYKADGTWQASDAWACQVHTYKEAAEGGGSPVGRRRSRAMIRV
jgi:hypothetical protein